MNVMNRPAQPPDHDPIEKLCAGLDRKFGYRPFRRKDCYCKSVGSMSNLSHDV